MTTLSHISYGKRGELETLIVDNPLGKAEISLFGAQVLSFIPNNDGKDRLWLSPHADLTGAKPIRGGIPLCWPWFGDDNGQDDDGLPAHGVLRNQRWSIKSTAHTETSTEIVFVPSSTAIPNNDSLLDVTLTVVVSDYLQVALTTTNNSTQATKFNGALHSYFAVERVVEAEIDGIHGDYKDKLDNWAVKPTPAPYSIHNGTDRVHLCTAPTTEIKGPTQHITVGHEGHDSIVVWNPWTSASCMPDMDAFGYKNMLCVETALTQWHSLQAGESHTLTQVIR